MQGLICDTESPNQPASLLLDFPFLQLCHPLKDHSDL